jgi:hypothetical protein
MYARFVLEGYKEELAAFCQRVAARSLSLVHKGKAERTAVLQIYCNLSTVLLQIVTAC